MEEETIVKLVSDKGVTKEFKILATFDIRETGKSYIVYTDYSLNKENHLNIYASTYTPNDEHPQLEPIKNKDELNFINQFLKSLEEEIVSEAT